ncbi:cbb3-type cytochrome c oxidase subunit 3 [Rhizobiales bacterium TNE-4]|nr:cbb3-type cytochrome c oxidase subunit 3 [Rhizobiales bacterium TNE-4]MBV1827808.1 cbb3-type cytochrome c oxidase subunit 3 [Rhizobiales bacterium TNE-4]
MIMTYQTLANFAQTWGLLGFMALFGLVLFYALRPSNKKMFDEAARIPLEKD